VTLTVSNVGSPANPSKADPNLAVPSVAEAQMVLVRHRRVVSTKHWAGFVGPISVDFTNFIILFVWWYYYNILQHDYDTSIITQHGVVFVVQRPAVPSAVCRAGCQLRFSQLAGFMGWNSDRPFFGPCYTITVWRIDYMTTRKIEKYRKLIYHYFSRIVLFYFWGVTMTEVRIIISYHYTSLPKTGQPGLIGTINPFVSNRGPSLTCWGGVQRSWIQDEVSPQNKVAFPRLARFYSHFWTSWNDEFKVTRRIDWSKGVSVGQQQIQGCQQMSAVCWK